MTPCHAAAMPCHSTDLVQSFLFLSGHAYMSPCNSKYPETCGRESAREAGGDKSEFGIRMRVAMTTVALRRRGEHVYELAILRLSSGRCRRWGTPAMRTGSAPNRYPEISKQSHRRRRKLAAAQSKMLILRIFSLLLPLAACTPIGRDANYHPVPHHLSNSSLFLRRLSPGANFLTSLGCECPHGGRPAPPLQLRMSKLTRDAHGASPVHRPKHADELRVLLSLVVGRRDRGARAEQQLHERDDGVRPARRQLLLHHVLAPLHRPTEHPAPHLAPLRRPRVRQTARE